MRFEDNSEHVCRSVAPVVDAAPDPRHLSRARTRAGYKRRLVTADLCSLGLASFLALRLWAPGGGESLGLGALALTIGFAVPVWLAVAGSKRLYHRTTAHPDLSLGDQLGSLFEMASVSTLAVFVPYGMASGAAFVPSQLVMFWALAFVLLVVGHGVVRALAGREKACSERAIIFGAGAVGQLVAQKIRHHPEFGVELVGFVDWEPVARASNGGPPQSPPVVGAIHDLPQIIRSFAVDRVIVAFSQDSTDDTLTALDAIRNLHVHVDIVPRLFEALGPHAEVHMLEGLPLLDVSPVNMARSSAIVKRLIDITLSAVALVVLAPALLMIGLLIRCDTDGPALYRHLRVGRHGRPFSIFKFRTMYLADCRGDKYGGESAERRIEGLMQDERLRDEISRSYKLNDDPRVTRVGHLLRRTSLDELPQLINVLRGEMSLVGPRPITADELKLYGQRASALLTIPPGITGYWQVNGRSNVSYDERVRLDMAYISSWSVRLDLLIMARTFRALFRGAR